MWILGTGAERTCICNFSTFTVILKVIVKSTVVSSGSKFCGFPQDLQPHVCGTDWTPALCVISSSRCDVHSFIYVLPLVPACSGFPLGCGSDRKQMRRSCRIAGPRAVSAVPWPHRLLHAPHGSTLHQGLQGLSIHSAKTVSSLPLVTIHIPAAKLCPWNSVLTTLPPLSIRSFALPAVNRPTSYSR